MKKCDKILKKTLDKIKSLLSCFIKFFNNKSILPKIYLDNCIVKKPDQKSIMMII